MTDPTKIIDSPATADVALGASTHRGVNESTTHADVTDSDRHAAEGPVGPVARWAIHRRLYDWVISFAHRPYAGTALFALSFVESSFFPIPPDVLLAPMCMSRRDRALRYAAITTIASVMGALLGYAIGWGAWDLLSPYLFDYVPGFTRETFARVEAWYESWGVWVLFIAAFTPIPYKVFTIAGGVFGQHLVPFIVVSIIGRGLRFYLVAGLFRWIGPKAMPLIDRYFNKLCILGTALLIIAVVIWRMFQSDAPADPG